MKEEISKQIGIMRNEIVAPYYRYVGQILRYIGDMLSVVMSHAKEGDVWLTVQTNVNIVAVSALVGIACIIVVEGMEPDEDAVSKANEQGVTILKSEETAFSLACRIRELL